MEVVSSKLLAHKSGIQSPLIRFDVWLNLFDKRMLPIFINQSNYPTMKLTTRKATPSKGGYLDLLKEGHSEGKRRSSSVQEISLRKGKTKKEVIEVVPQANRGTTTPWRVLVSGTSQNWGEVWICRLELSRTNLSLKMGACYQTHFKALGINSFCRKGQSQSLN